jgi:hypothetical protein
MCGVSIAAVFVTTPLARGSQHQRNVPRMWCEVVHAEVTRGAPSLNRSTVGEDHIGTDLSVWDRWWVDSQFQRALANG